MDPHFKCDEDYIAIIKSSTDKKGRKVEPQDLLATPTAQTEFLSIDPTWTITWHRWAFFCFSCLTLTITTAERHETMASWPCPGLKPRPSLPRVSYALNPLYTSRPLVPQGLPCPPRRDFYRAFGEVSSFSGQIWKPAAFPGYLTPTVSVSEPRYYVAGVIGDDDRRGELCFGSSLVEAAKTYHR